MIKWRNKTGLENNENKIAGPLRMLKIPGFIFGAFLVFFIFFSIFRGRAEATPIDRGNMNWNFSAVCRSTGEIKRDEPLSVFLVKAGISPKLANEIATGLGKVLDVRKIKPGDIVTVDTDSLGELIRFELARTPWEKYCVKKENGFLLGSKDTIPLTYVIRSSKGEVTGTLWESMKKKGVPPEAILTFTDILSYDIDFLTDTRNGQRFAIMYEEFLFYGKPVKVGRVIAAQYWMSDTNYSGIFFEDPSGKKGYYNRSGKNTKKALLKTPLVYRRISSHFTNRRFHPILKTYRPHHGVDYTAPTGTPVSSSGDGVVIFAGWKGGYGNYIEVAHSNNIVTCYGHLSKFAKGIKKGTKVSQGQLIGYVGSTGLSSGPHLDYRVRVAGKNVNPLKYTFPDGPPVEQKYMSIFKETIVDYLALLNVMSPPTEMAELNNNFDNSENDSIALDNGK